jgi:cob(I)alamin adenosyltransferase
MKFYSGKGDKGTTTLFGSGKRRPKTDKIFGALGVLDELNSYLGVCLSLSNNYKITVVLEDIQQNLFILQAEIGGAKIESLKQNKLKLLEKATDEFGIDVGVITNFTLSGGTPLSAHLDYARTIARRVERQLCDLDTRCPSGHRVSAISYAYLNRLSSLLFVLARYENKIAGIREKNPKYK